MDSESECINTVGLYLKEPLIDILIAIYIILLVVLLVLSIGLTDTIRPLWIPNKIEGARRELEDVKKERDELKRRLEPSDVGRVQKDLDDIKKKRESLLRREDNKKRELEEIKKERDELQMRLSEVMSSRLVTNNPDIADLTDMNRPTKLAERNNELYDNQWTEAFESVEAFQKKSDLAVDDEAIIQYLLDILKGTSDFCQTKTSNILESVRNLAEEIGCQDDDLFNKVVTERKHLAPNKVPSLHEVQGFLQKKLEDNRWVGLLDDKAVKDYIKECTFVCWMMQAQSPPLIFLFDAGDNPKQTFKEYTRTGKQLDFVVWPCQLLHKDGPILSRGTAQFR